jgi:NAD+ synthase (glutamine-hydrolysing)
MNIALAQINTKIADFINNRQNILNLACEAKEQGAELIVFPELAVCGYPPLDLMTYPAFIQQNIDTISWLCEQLPADIAVAVGYVDKNHTGVGKPYHNDLAVIYGNEVIHRQAKTLLPTYDVFDEDRYFEPARERTLLTFKGVKIGFAICEDIWAESVSDHSLIYPVDPVKDLGALGAQIIIAPSASPFYSGKTEVRRSLVQQISRDHGCITIYVNAVGANDSLIFDGNSIVSDASGRIICHAQGFCEDLVSFETEQAAQLPEVDLTTIEDTYENLYQALVLGVKDYMAKTGFSSANLGLSGGVDSALVAVIAAEALGADHVHTYAMPSRYSSDHSLSDAKQLAENLRIGYEVIPIESLFTAATGTLAESFRGTSEDVTEENMQARIRGLLLMAWSNKKGSLLLTTGNKSEMATGYCTLYGDMCGSLAVIGDLFKTEVFALCRHINKKAGYDLIPEHILTKPPSAELRHDQKDEDSLPPYEVLDGILKAHIMDCTPFDDIVAMGYDRETVRGILRLVERCEYKRRQAAIVIKVSEKAFGNGRRIPIARALYETQ